MLHQIIADRVCLARACVSIGLEMLAGALGQLHVRWERGGEREIG